MEINTIVNAIIAIVVAYLLGALPTAYVVTRLLTGKDIRQLGSGNVGANNTFREVGMAGGVTVAIVDIGKGTAAVAIAHAITGVPLFEPNLYVLMAAFAAVAGHIWPVYLRFTGGNGLATTIGTLILLLPLETAIFFALIILLRLITRNFVLSVYLSLISVPISAWFIEKDWLYVGYSLVMILLLVLVFIPTARAAMVTAGNKENLISDLLRRDKQ